MKQAEDAGRVEPFAWVNMPDYLHWLVCLKRGSLGAGEWDRTAGGPGCRAARVFDAVEQAAV